MQLLDAEHKKPDDKKAIKILFIIIAIYSLCNPSLIAFLDGYTVSELLISVVSYTFFARLGFVFCFVFLALFRVILVIITDAIGITETSDSKLERDQTMLLLYFIVICDSLILAIVLLSEIKDSFNV